MIWGFIACAGLVVVLAGFLRRNAAALAAGCLAVAPLFIVLALSPQPWFIRAGWAAGCAFWLLMAARAFRGNVPWAREVP